MEYSLSKRDPVRKRNSIEFGDRFFTQRFEVAQVLSWIMPTFQHQKLADPVTSFLETSDLGTNFKILSSNPAEKVQF